MKKLILILMAVVGHAQEHKNYPVVKSEKIEARTRVEEWNKRGKIVKFKVIYTDKYFDVHLPITDCSIIMRQGWGVARMQEIGGVFISKKYLITPTTKGFRVWKR